MKIYFNGKFFPESSPIINVFDQGFYYGFGLFETMCFLEGKLLHYAPHFARFKRGARILGIHLPVDKKNLYQAIVKTLKINKLKNAYVRIILNPVSENIGTHSRSKGTNLLIVTKALSPIAPKLYEKFSPNF